MIRYMLAFLAAGVLIGSVRADTGTGPDPKEVQAVLNKAYGPPSFSDDVLTDVSGFRGVLGAFRFHDDGTNERALAVCRVAPSGGEVLSPAPSQF